MKWALKGTDRCAFHGGRKIQRHQGKGKPPRISHLPRFYRQQLSKTLDQVVEEHLSMSPDEQLNLFEELALMRNATKRTVDQYALALNAGKEELIVAAAEEMKAALHEVEGMCKSAALIVQGDKDKFSIHNLKFVINQIIRCVHRVFEGDNPTAEKLERLIRTTVKLPTEAQGTDITPDQDVVEMDSTIPKE